MGKSFTIPGLPPTTNAGFKFGNGRMYQTEAYREFKANAGWFVPQDFEMIPKDQPVRLEVTFYYVRNRDIDNLKCLLDSLQGRCYEDDIQIVKLDVAKVKADSKDDVRTLVVCEPWYVSAADEHQPDNQKNR